MKMSMNARLAKLVELDEDPQDPEDTKHFALRADGTIVFLDAEGWFAVVDTGPGTTPDGQQTDTLLMLEGPDGTREEAYLEPVWLAGYRECFPMI